jgi:hypothetical protein
MNFSSPEHGDASMRKLAYAAILLALATTVVSVQTPRTVPKAVTEGAAAFGSEAFWGDALQLHKAIAGEKNGGVGPGVSPKTALSVGLKVDAEALPDASEAALQGHGLWQTKLPVQILSGAQQRAIMNSL